MPKQAIGLEPNLYQYLIDHSVTESPIAKKLRADTLKTPYAEMQILPEQGQFLALLVKLFNAKHVLEIGVFHGYSTLKLAEALPTDGYILACDKNKEWTDVAKIYWQQANVAHKIDFRLGMAVDTLNAIVNELGESYFDLAFIDADKINYDHYYELSLRLVRKNGLIVLDNVLWSGAVLDENNQQTDTCSIRKINQKIVKDNRVDIAMLPIGDGMTLAIKR